MFDSIKHEHASITNTNCLLEKDYYHVVHVLLHTDILTGVCPRIDLHFVVAGHVLGKFG